MFTFIYNNAKSAVQLLIYFYTPLMMNVINKSVLQSTGNFYWIVIIKHLTFLPFFAFAKCSFVTNSPSCRNI